MNKKSELETASAPPKRVPSRAYQETGSTYWPTDKTSLKEKLPAGTYSVNYHEKMATYYLERQSDFSLPRTLYGDTAPRANRILHTFQQRSGSTGLLLTGKKGSGKTLLAKVLSVSMVANQGLTLLVNQAFHGEAFNTFIANIDQEAVVIFDEFEKVYAKPAHQASLLTLFDGTYPSKKLYVVTCNERNKLDTNLINRPGRLHYSLHFSGLGAKFIESYCSDELVHQPNTPGVVEFARQFGEFSFDMLQALVAEMNMYGEPANEAAEMLNLSPALDGDTQYRPVLVNSDGLVLKHGWVNPASVGNPLGLTSPVSFSVVDEDDEAEAEDTGQPVLKKSVTVRVSAANLLCITDAGNFEFATQTPGYTLRFEKTSEAARRTPSFFSPDEDD